MSVPVALIATAGGLALLGVIIFAARKATSNTSPNERQSTTSVESNSTPIARHGQESTINQLGSFSNSESIPDSDSDYKSAHGSISGGKSKRKKKTKRKSKKNYKM